METSNDSSLVLALLQNAMEHGEIDAANASRALDLAVRLRTLEQLCSCSEAPEAEEPQPEPVKRSHHKKPEAEAEPKKPGRPAGYKVPEKKPDETPKEMKKRVYARLEAFRAEHGLGCYAEIIEASKGTVSDDNLRSIHEGSRVDEGIYLAIDKALDKLMKRSA